MKVFTTTDAEAYIKKGDKAFRYNRNIQITPGAKDLMTEAGIKMVFQDGACSSAAPTPSTAPSSGSQGGDYTYPDTLFPPVNYPPKAENTASYKPEHIELFNSEEARKVKFEICCIGQRMWQREYVDGNGGNISYRIGPNEILCTPTLVSKGFLSPEMICLVDLEGNQLAGEYRRTSEVTTHLAIYKNTPAAKAVTHAHPVHGTAFAMAGLEPPQCLIPEQEVFVGKVPLAPYRTPGSSAMADVIGPLSPKHQAILMGNHGVIAWGSSVEDSFFKMEIVDAYCRTVVIASHLPSRNTTIPNDEMGKLLDMKKGMGLPDSREELKPVQLCEIDPWEFMKNPSSCGCETGTGSESPAVDDSQVEAMVQKITDKIMAGIK